MSNFGTTPQCEYATKLATKAGFATLEAAAEASTGRPTLNFAVTPFTNKEASRVISFLEQRLNITKGSKASTPDSAPSANGTHAPASDDGKPKAKFLTAKHLRLIATRQQHVPHDLDDEARWVLTRLQRLDAIEAFVSRGLPDQRRAINGNDPIQVAQVVEYFGGDQVAADAFDVSLQTLRAWGAHLPPVHAFKAEVLTNGYVQAPRG